MKIILLPKCSLHYNQENAYRHLIVLLRNRENAYRHLLVLLRNREVQKNKKEKKNEMGSVSVGETMRKATS